MTIDTQINALSLCESGARHRKQERLRQPPSIPFHIKILAYSWQIIIFTPSHRRQLALPYTQVEGQKGFSFILFSIIYSLCSSSRHWRRQKGIKKRRKLLLFKSEPANVRNREVFRRRNLISLPEEKPLTLREEKSLRQMIDCRCRYR